MRWSPPIESRQPGVEATTASGSASKPTSFVAYPRWWDPTNTTTTTKVSCGGKEGPWWVPPRKVVHHHARMDCGWAHYYERILKRKWWVPRGARMSGGAVRLTDWIGSHSDIVAVHYKFCGRPPSSGVPKRERQIHFPFFFFFFNIKNMD